MTTSTNPYASFHSSSIPSNAGSQVISLLFTIVGVITASIAGVGSVFRLAAVVQQQADQWRTIEARIGDAAPVVGLCLFAITACTLLILLASQGTVKTQDLISQAFIVIAALAMLSRTLYEPSVGWTPHWPSYVLSISAGIAMAMVWRRFRVN